MGLNEAKLDVEALVSAARLGGRDALRALPQVQNALGSRFQAFTTGSKAHLTASGIPILPGTYVLGFVGANDELIAVVAERHDNTNHAGPFDEDQLRAEEMFLAFLEGVLCG
jgi:hypothetical protein